MRVRLGHLEFADQQPFRAVDETDLVHFFLYREGLLLVLPQSFARADQPVDGDRKDRARDRFLQEKDAVLGEFFVGEVVLFGFREEENDGVRVGCGVDREADADVLSDGGVHDDEIKVALGKRPLCDADARDRLHRREGGDGKVVRRRGVELFGRRNDENAVNPFFEIQVPSLPSLDFSDRFYSLQ